jgi:septal ring factor EnvC (AmiA/AmiB activator)
MAWALGIGSVAAVLTVSILGFLLHRGLLSRANTDSDERRRMTIDRDRVLSENASLLQTITTHEKNAAAVNRQVGDITTTNRSLAARLAASETTNHDLLAALEASHASGALPLALRAELDRLRSFMPGPSEAAATTAPGDQGSGGDDPVHGQADIHPPR